MRDKQVARYLQTWNGFSRGLISSDKPSVRVTLSSVLEQSVDQKYFLSAKAARGILRRAERRGKALPEMLQQALEGVAMGIEPMETAYGSEKGAVTLEEWEAETPIP